MSRLGRFLPLWVLPKQYSFFLLGTLNPNVPYSFSEWSLSAYNCSQFSTDGCSKIKRSSGSFCWSCCCVRYVSTLYMGICILSLSSFETMDTSSLSLVMLPCAGIPFCSCIISLVMYFTIFYSASSVGFELPDRPLDVSVVSSRLPRRLWAFDLFDEVFASSLVFNFFDFPFFLAIDDIRGKLHSW
jgi:hypothetical protein